MELVIINFEKFMELNKEKIYEIARKNTVYNAEGHAVITKDDEWRNEDEWDILYEKLMKENESIK